LADESRRKLEVLLAVKIELLAPIGIMFPRLGHFQSEEIQLKYGREGLDRSLLSDRVAILRVVNRKQ
jgi:hypothetical protein